MDVEKLAEKLKDLMLLDIVITGGVNLRSNFSPSVSLI